MEEITAATPRHPAVLSAGELRQRRQMDGTDAQWEEQQVEGHSIGKHNTWMDVVK